MKAQKQRVATQVKSRVNSANKLFPEPAFPYLRGGNILSGPLEFFTSSGMRQQLVFVARFNENTRCSFLFVVICIRSHGNTPKVAKECAGCLIPPSFPLKYGSVSLLLLNSVICTKRKLKNSTRRPLRQLLFRD